MTVRKYLTDKLDCKRGVLDCAVKRKQFRLAADLEVAIYELEQIYMAFNGTNHMDEMMYGG